MTTTAAMLSLEDIEELAVWALDEHGLSAKGWTLGWDLAVRRAGACHFGSRRITLSRPVFSIVENRDSVLDTIFHEVAHADADAAPGPATAPVAALGRCRWRETPALHVVHRPRNHLPQHLPV